MASTYIHPINIFMGIRQQNVTFCLDMSGSMYNTLNSVKEHLIQYLLEQSVIAEFNVHRLFNLIGFSTEVYPWATSLVLWNKATVNSCLDWIRDLETKTGTNTLDALLTAFADEKCQAVSLVTDDIPDQEPYTVLNQVSLVANGRPVHCVYILNGRDEDRSTTEFLQNLASITQGSLKIVNCDRHGVVKITPVSSFDTATSMQLANLTINASGYKQAIVNSVVAQNLIQPLVQSSIVQPSPMAQMIAPCASVPCGQVWPFSQPQTIISTFPNTGGFFNPSYTYPKWIMEPSIYKYPTCLPRVHVTTEGKIPCRAIAWSRYRPVKVLYDGKVHGLTLEGTNLPIPNDIAYAPDAGSLLLNKTVVARSTLDGYYYKGKVLSQILAHRFMIQFGPNTHGKFKDHFYQNTAIYDIIHYDDTIQHTIRPNDKVLALIDGSEKYAPAEVLEGFEQRTTNNETDKSTPNQPITVRFANGRTRSCPFNEAIWIPDVMHDRIKFELNLPTTARKYLEEFNDDYPKNSLPGYPTTQSTTILEDVVMPRMVYDIWPYFVPFYPLYQNILYPGINNARAQLTNLASGPGAGLGTIAPNYFRQIRSNAAVVNADCLNRSVVGTTLTPKELDMKIRNQIQLNRHMIAPPQCLSKRCASPIASPQNRCQSSCSLSTPPSTCSSPPSPPTYCSSDSCHDNDNPHYNKYQHLIQNLYKECEKPDTHSKCSQADEMKRAKSVTFCRDSRKGIENEDCEEKCCIKELKHKSQKLLKRNSNNNLENRFGNPKVSVGLPEKSFYRPRSAFSNLNQSDVKMKFAKREQAQKENYQRREQGTIERLLQEQKKQEKRDRYRQVLTDQIQDFEKRRTETNLQKSLDVAKAKQEKNIMNKSRVESMKIDMEAKDQARIDHLRNEFNKRTQQHQEKVNTEARKEENKMAFKRANQEKQNMEYHNRLVAEEGMRRNQTVQLQKFHNQNKCREESREAKGQKVADLQQHIKQSNKDLFQINAMNGDPK